VTPFSSFQTISKYFTSRSRSFVILPFKNPSMSAGVLKSPLSRTLTSVQSKEISPGFPSALICLLALSAWAFHVARSGGDVAVFTSSPRSVPFAAVSLPSGVFFP
jgi:hypothetical protein